MKETGSPVEGVEGGQSLSSSLLEETRRDALSQSVSSEEKIPVAAQRNAYTKPVSYKIIVLGESGVGGF